MPTIYIYRANLFQQGLCQSYYSYLVPRLTTAAALQTKNECLSGNKKSGPKLVRENYWSGEKKSRKNIIRGEISHL